MARVLITWPVAAAPFASGSTDRGTAIFESTLWMAGVVAVIFVTVLVLWAVRRRLGVGNLTPESPFTLDQLRGLRDRGTVTSEEYQALRRRAINELGGGEPQKD